MSGGLDLGQPVHSDSGSFGRLVGIMGALTVLLGACVYVAVAYWPNTDAARAEQEQLRQIAREHSITFAGPGVVYLSCKEVACDEATAQFDFLREGIEPDNWRHSTTVTDTRDNVIGLIYRDRRLQIVEQE